MAQGALRLGLTEKELLHCKNASTPQEGNIRLTVLRQKIKKTYYKLSRELHPDRNPDNSKKAEEFKIISCAYSDVSKFLSNLRIDAVRSRPAVRPSVRVTITNIPVTPQAATFGSNWWAKYESVK